MKANKNSSANCIIVLFTIAVVCVALLGIFNDVLYVPPDMSVFNKAAEGTYSERAVENVSLSYGKVEVVVDGTLESGEKVVGLYVTGNKSGKADGFSLAVIVNTESDEIVGLYEITDGSTGGYEWNEEKLSSSIGTKITSENYLALDGLVQTGTTNSSTAVKNALMTAAEYYSAAIKK